jgi:hypothetical protein
LIRSPLHLICFVALVLITIYGSALGQRTSSKRNELAPLSSSLLDSSQKYLESLRELLRLQEKEQKKATQKLEHLQLLVAEGLITKRELEGGQQAVVTAQSILTGIKEQIADADRTVAEMEAMEESSVAPMKATKSHVNLTVLRYIGLHEWSLANLPSVQTFFSNNFGRPLPTTAIGQSATHNRLGWDHRNSVDVGIHPDSSEGQAFIRYLQGQGIPFLAFRSTITGVATGPHIHIGRPSHRLGNY